MARITPTADAGASLVITVTDGSASVALTALMITGTTLRRGLKAGN
ncbi:hypothetical protein [Roseisalinus antarcticus]|uniref:Uncharacterized protein n=1 Tax=Roseisalinus antarcticus TaxID=254357 RepID=A0A1Y5TW79_9RHOB|nr:hypothetical protein [Roseisalinus antarcticus]SLN75055.1 hypothetical protein ROA7023_03883 [Roseisalinus antarcticus]